MVRTGKHEVFGCVGGALRADVIIVQYLSLITRFEFMAPSPRVITALQCILIFELTRESCMASMKSNIFQAVSRIMHGKKNMNHRGNHTVFSFGFCFHFEQLAILNG